MNIAQAHAFCAALPGATLDYKWRFEDSVHPVYSVGGRMFAMFSMKKERLIDQLLFKTADDRFLALTDRAGIVAAPYLAKARWVKLDSPKRLPDAELCALLAEAHALILAKATKKLQAAILGTALPSTPPPAAPPKKVAAGKVATKIASKVARTAAPAKKRATKKAPMKKSPAMAKTAVTKPRPRTTAVATPKASR